jgi:hypothetical protein
MALGLSSAQITARVRTGTWTVSYRGVYHLAGVPLTDLAVLRTAVLVGGPSAAVSHRSAAWLWGLGPSGTEASVRVGMAPREWAPDEMAEPTITVRHNRIVRVGGIQVVRTRAPLQPVVRRGLPCTSLARTMADCAATMDAPDLDDLIDRALARRVVRLETLQRMTRDPALYRHRGRLLLSERMRARGMTVEPHPSVLESRMGRLLHRYRLPTPTAELAWGPNRRYRLDFAYRDIRLAIEVDGWTAHSTPERQRYDHRRSNALMRDGWTVLHYDWWEVSYEAERVAREIAETHRLLTAAA